MPQTRSSPPDQGCLLQLQLTPLFSGLRDTDIADLIEGAWVETLGHEHPLFAQGETVEHFFVVLDGHVELSLEAGGRRSVIEVVRAGTVLGDAAMFGEGRFMLSARVLTGATVLSIPAASFLAKLGARFDIITHMLSTLSFGLRMRVRQIAELKLKTTAQRLGSFLLSMVDAEADNAVVRFPYDKKLVADELGMKPESLSRALAKLQPAGVESLPDNAVAIADVGRLRDFCVEDDLG